jgi:PKD domain
VFTYAIDWNGDGVVDQTVTGPAGLSVTHRYATPAAYTVKVTATDMDGSASNAVSQNVLITTTLLQGGVLAVGGTPGDDAFALTAAANNSVKATLNGQVLGTFAPSTGTILLFGDGGNDSATVNGTAAADTFAVTGDGVDLNSFNIHIDGIGSETLNGLGGSDSLTGLNQTNHWLLTGNGAGTLNGAISFTSMTSLIGGAGDDTFSFADGGSIPGTIDGKGGSNTLDYSSRSTAVTVTLVAGSTNKATATGGWTNIENLIGSAAATDTVVGANISNIWDVTGPNAGNLNGTLAFTGIENLTGASISDSFVFLPGGSISGNLTGGAPDNTIDYSAFGSSVTVNLAAKTATGIGGTWTNVQSFIGAGLADTLIGAAANNTWSITGANSGTVGAYSFAGFANLIGGSGNDTFKILVGGSLSGSLDGQGGTNTIDDSSFGSPVTVNLQSATATAIGGAWANIQSFKGTNTADTLIAPDGSNNNWVLKGSNAGTLNTLAFAGFANLMGGSGNDMFTFNNNATVTGVIDGRGGSNTLNYSAYTAGVTVNLGNATVDLANDSATGVYGGAANGIANIGTVVVGAGNNFLTAAGLANNVTFVASGNGNNILVGGAGSNTLTASGTGNNILIGGHGAATINGGTGYNLLIGGFTAYDAIFADLEYILGVWKTVNSAKTYAKAISSLTAASFPFALTSGTVHSVASDQINAGVHLLDWYFAAQASEISGENAGETEMLG